MREIEAVFKACADKNRIRILKLLEQRKLCVCEIAFVLRITQPSVSKHLKRLKAAGIIETEQDSFWTNYYIKPKSRYAKEICSFLRKTMNGDNAVKRDISKLKKAKREKLCCKKMT